MGRTRVGVLDSTEFTSDGAVRRVGTNQIGRYSIHFHHAFGPRTTPANGYQFTLIGNAVDDASKWGITIHNSHYGLVRDNVVYNSRGAAIVAEDGTESFNVFERNFAMRSEGSGEFAPRSGYGGATNDPGGEGAGFWLRGPNNILRNNVAANVDVFGYGIAAGGLGTVRIPKFKGADTSKDGEFVEIDTTDAPVLEFTGNEAYGAIQTGVAIGWNGTLTNSRMWHTSRHAVTAFPTDRLVVDGFVGARRFGRAPAAQFENPTGIWFGNYAAKTVTVRNANVQGMRVGVASPFFAKTDTEPGRGDGVATIENSYFRDYVGVAVATAYSPADHDRGDQEGGRPQQPVRAAGGRGGHAVPRGRHLDELRHVRRGHGSSRSGHRLRLQWEAGRYVPCVLLARGAGDQCARLQHRPSRDRRVCLRRRRRHAGVAPLARRSTPNVCRSTNSQLPRFLGVGSLFLGVGAGPGPVGNGRSWAMGVE